MTEIWLPVVDWADFYEVSDHGRVQSLDRVIIKADGTSARWRGKLLRPSLKRSRNGVVYHVVTLTAPGRRRVANIGHLVLESHVGPRPDGLECCHHDDDGTHNHLANLRWDTRRANVLDQIRNGRHANNLPHARRIA